MVEGAFAWWWVNGAAETIASAQTAIRIESFFMWFVVLSADETGDHMLSGRRRRIYAEVKIFGFQNRVSAPHRTNALSGRRRAV